MRRILAAVLAAASAAPAGLAQTEWLPAHVREGLERSVAEKLQAIDEAGRLTPERALDGVRTAVDRVATKLESLGMERVLAMAPSYPDLEPPASGTAALDALAAYQLCSVPFDREYADDSPRENRYDLRAWSLLLSASVYVVSSYLRQGYLAAGVSDEQAEAFLGSDAVAGLRARIWASEELLESVRERCREPLVTLMR